MFTTFTTFTVSIKLRRVATLANPLHNKGSLGNKFTMFTVGSLKRSELVVQCGARLGTYDTQQG